MKAKKSYKRGGMMEPIIGMPKSKKLEKLKPIGVSKITTGETMKAASDKARKLKDPSLRKTVAEVEKPRRKKRRKLENGGKVKRTANVNLRGKGKKKEPLKNMVYAGPSAGPDYGDYMNQERAAAGGFNKMEKITPRGPKRINNDAAMKAMVTSPKVRKSTATIPVPAKKKRRLRRK